MADSHDNGNVHKSYMMVFVALGVFTALSFVFNFAARHEIITNHLSAGLIMSVGVVKACLVGYIFMHLKWDWSKLYYLIIPAFILGTMMMMVLFPDILEAWFHPLPTDYHPWQ